METEGTGFGQRENLGGNKGDGAFFVLGDGEDMVVEDGFEGKDFLEFFWYGTVGDVDKGDV